MRVDELLVDRLFSACTRIVATRRSSVWMREAVLKTDDHKR